MKIKLRDKLNHNMRYIYAIRIRRQTTRCLATGIVTKACNTQVMPDCSLLIA